MTPGRAYSCGAKRALLFSGLVIAAALGASLSAQSSFAFPSAARDRTAAAGPAPVAQADAYVLLQDSKTVGPQIITITPGALRCEAIKSHIVLLCSAPDWQVLIYNPQTRLSHRTPYRNFSGYLQKQMVFFSGASYFDKPVVVKHRGTFLGWPGTLFCQPPGYRAKIDVGYRQKSITGGEPAEITYKVLQLPGLSKEVESVMERYYSVPQKGGVPIEYSYISLVNEKKHFLTTTKVSREKVDPALFKPPAGLTNSKNFEEVFLDGRSEGSSDLFDMMQGK